MSASTRLCSGRPGPLRGGRPPAAVRSASRSFPRRSIRMSCRDRLTEALPELDRDVVLRVSARLDQLDALRDEAATLREVSQAVARFARTYRDWARAALRERGGNLNAKVREAQLRTRALEHARAALAAARAERGVLAARQQELDEALAAARAAERRAAFGRGVARCRASRRAAASRRAGRARAGKRGTRTRPG